jgi:hypothetical protein
MSDCDIGCDGERNAGVSMQHCAILNVTVFTNVDGFIIAALNHTLTLFSRMTEPITEALSATK